MRMCKSSARAGMNQFSKCLHDVQQVRRVSHDDAVRRRNKLRNVDVAGQVSVVQRPDMLPVVRVAGRFYVRGEIVLRRT